MTTRCTQFNRFSLGIVGNDTTPLQQETPLRVLTLRMQKGDDAAWLEFHERYYFWLLRYSASRSSSHDDAVEVTQQAYLRVARHIKAFDDEAGLRRWLACIVRCAAADHHRGARRRSVLLEKLAHWQEAESAGNEKDVEG
jgi:DNA-directed RNA polymerase specialized sigma24 family protein